MPENILGVLVTPTISTADGLFYNHNNQPSPTQDLAAISAAANASAGRSVDTTLLAGQFALFMGQYNPFLSNTIYKSTQTAQPTQGTNTVTTSLSPYYNGLFKTVFDKWVNQTAVRSLLTSTSSADRATSLTDFQNYLALNPTTAPIRQKQENVLFWQFTYLLDLFAKLQNTVIRQASDPLKFFDAQVVAQRAAAATTIPAVYPSKASKQVPEPTSIQALNEAQISLEKYNQGFNASSDRQRQTQTNLSFSRDALTQVGNANNTFWQTMGKLLNAVQNL